MKSSPKTVPRLSRFQFRNTPAVHASVLQSYFIVFWWWFQAKWLKRDLTHLYSVQVSDYQLVKLPLEKPKDEEDTLRFINVTREPDVPAGYRLEWTNYFEGYFAAGSPDQACAMILDKGMQALAHRDIEHKNYNYVTQVHPVLQWLYTPVITEYRTYNRRIIRVQRIG